MWFLLNDMNIYMYVNKEHSLNEELGKQHSVYQIFIRWISFTMIL